MVGIVSIGVHIPIYRLGRDEIAKAWGTRGGGGEKAVAGFDEDSVTMAVAAVLSCMKRNKQTADGLFFATTTSPYKEKQAATIIATVVDLPRESHTADYTGSLRAATIAMNAAIDSVKSGSAKNIIITASDRRMGAAQSRYEQDFGDGAAALIIGNENVIAHVEGSYSIFNEFFDVWRMDGDTMVRSADERFANSEGYLRTMQEAISGLMKKCRLAPADISKAVFYAPDARNHATLAKTLGFDPKAQLQDLLFATMGNTGAAASLMMLTAALEEAKPGNKILFAGYGDGCDVFLLSVTENITKVQAGPKIKDLLAKKVPISYEKYISWRNLMPIEAARLGDPKVPSIPALWRERKSVLALFGVRCKQCGTPQYPPTRVCAVCQSKDNFEDYKFSDKRGSLFTYAIDHLAITPDPPGVNGVIDFDGGGRILCDLTDCDPKKVKIDLPVEMTFRRLYQSGGINNYFWKARPLAQ